MNKLGLVVVLLLSVPYVLATEEGCSERVECWPEGSAMHTGLLLKQTQLQLLQQVQQAHAELLGQLAAGLAGEEALASPLIQAVQAQYRTWRSFTRKECALLAVLSGAASSWQSVHALECEVGLVRQRLQQTDQALQCMQTQSLEEQQTSVAGCLYPMLNLAKPQQH